MVNVTPRPIYSLERDPVAIYRLLGGPQDRSRRLREISPTPGFDPRTVQTVARRYTDYAVSAHDRLQI